VPRRLMVGSLVGLSAVFMMLVATPAGARGRPITETITFSETFEDAELTDACGVEVTTTVDGRITFFTFPDQPVGPQGLTSVHVNFVARAGNHAARFHDVGIDIVQVMPDGTAILMIVGQIPFDFTGVLMIDLATGEAILEPVHVLTTDRVCSLLTT
jgi:hypothetical protein